MAKSPKGQKAEEKEVGRAGLGGGHGREAGWRMEAVWKGRGSGSAKGRPEWKA